MMKNIVGLACCFAVAKSATFVVVDTNQSECYNDIGDTVTCGTVYTGQDAEHDGPAPGYQRNGDGTITDLNTGLMWAKTTIANVNFTDGDTVASRRSIGGYTDWRVPTVKELYSLIDFTGVTGTSEDDNTPYIDTDYFEVEYYSSGDRYIDCQYLTSNQYVSTVMDQSDCFFGVNFVDGRIKCYPLESDTGYNLRLVRDAENAFENSYVDNGDDTITDSATDLMWTKYDSGNYPSEAGSLGDGRVDWEEAMDWCESLSLSGYSDWRLPNAKELQSIVDYSRSPDTTNSPAIDTDFFEATSILDPDGNTNWGYAWTSTTHLDGAISGQYAVYIAFGEAQGDMNVGVLMDVHGAGAQRSDPKSGDVDDYPQYFGPQGDVLYVYNYARCVRDV